MNCARVVWETMAGLYVLDYSFAMKYVVIFVVALMVARVDLLLHLYDKVMKKVDKQSPPEVQTSDLGPAREVIPLSEDRTLKSTDRATFLSYMEEFKNNPKRDFKDKALDILRTRPSLLGPTLDGDFESALFRWRDLIPQKAEELPFFLIGLMNLTQGQNLEATKRFFALIMDANMELFIRNYSQTKDTNCMVAGLVEASLSDETKYSELMGREKAVTLYLHREKLDPINKALAENCQTVLKMEISKLPPPPSSPDDNSESDEGIWAAEQP